MSARNPARYFLAARGELDAARSAPSDGYRLTLGVRVPVTARLPGGECVGYTRILDPQGAAIDFPELRLGSDVAVLTLHLPSGDVELTASLPGMRGGVWVAHFRDASSAAQEQLYQFLVERAGLRLPERAPRVPLRAQVLILGEQVSWVSTSLDLSESGARVACPYGLRLNGVYRLRIDLRVRVFWLDAELVRLDHEIAAFRFLDVAADDHRALRAYVTAAGDELHQQLSVPAPPQTRPAGQTASPKE